MAGPQGGGVASQDTPRLEHQEIHKADSLQILLTKLQKAPKNTT